MKCEKIREQIGGYWDLPETDPRRREVDEHVRTCPACSEEFKIWEESNRLIRRAPKWSDSSDPASKPVPIADKVMDRIYSEESWKLPVSERIHGLSYKLRRNLTLVIAFCMAVFMVSFFHSLFNRPVPRQQEAEDYAGIVPVASAVNHSDSTAGTLDSLQGVPVASISDPLILRVGHMSASPDYLLIISILGMALTILIMNWLMRVRA